VSNKDTQSPAPNRDNAISICGDCLRVSVVNQPILISAWKTKRKRRLASTN